MKYFLPDTNISLTSRMFRFLVLSFFVSNIMTVAGSMMDSFAVGNLMDEDTIAAVGFVSPAILLFSIIGTTAGVGFQVTCIRSLSKGDREHAGRALGYALILGVGASVMVMLLTLIFTAPIVDFLSVSSDSAGFESCVAYLRGTAIGLPAITAMSILTRGVHIEGRRDMALLSVAIMVVINMLSDFIGINLIHFGPFLLTLDTSLSYYAGTAVLLYYYLRMDSLAKPVLKDFSVREMISVNKVGLAAGIVGVCYSISLILKAELINIGIADFSMGSVGTQAYNVTVQVNYFVNALMNSAVAAMFLLGGMFNAEEDKANFKRIIKNVVAYEIVTTAVFSILMWALSGVIAEFYLGNVRAEVLQGTALALKAYAAGLIFQMIVLVFANYVQCFGHYATPIIVFFISNVLFVMFGEAYGIAVAGRWTVNAAAGIFAGVAGGHFAAVLILPIFIAIINKRNGCKFSLWMFPKKYGVPVSEEISANIATQKDVVEFSEKAWKFCTDKGESTRIAYLTSLAVEEMAKNVIDHGFTKDKRKHVLNARIVHKADQLIIRMRDNCVSFDPREKYEQIYASGDSRNMGIRMIIAEASEVNYTTMFNLNNLLIRIKK